MDGSLSPMAIGEAKSELDRLEEEMATLRDVMASHERKRDILHGLIQEYGDCGDAPTEPLQAESAIHDHRDHPHPHPEPAPPEVYEEVDLTGATNLNERMRRVGRVVCSKHRQSVNLTLAARLIQAQTKSKQPIQGLRSKISGAISHMWEYRRVTEGYYWYDETNPPSLDP